MAIKAKISTPAVEKTAKQHPSNKRLLVMLLIVAVLTIWTLLKNNTEDTDTIELADSAVVSSKNNHQTHIRTGLNSAKNPQQNKQINIVTTQNASNDKRLIAWQKLQREPLLNQPHNVFKVHSWLVVPKPVKTKALPPPPPVAPPAPFTYMGKLENSPQGTQLFLLRNGQLYTTLKGQKIDAQWRLDGDDLNNIQLTYLPLNLPQVLSKTAKSFDSANAVSPTAAEMNL
ncbi:MULTISPECIES: hypothetical protein [Methylotenera]|uniref:hypothetical protein n=1 Tax=Methylotenera TaxID=359407 RepID=UPI000371D93A|nr:MULTISPECIES: hypothetical protein [Methylotenera]